MDADEVRSILGVWILGALLRRELLSIPQHIFGFVDKYEGVRAVWWPSARREALLMADTVQAMYADLGAVGAYHVCH